MSNNTYNFLQNSVDLAINNKDRVLGFITQKSVETEFICMTPGISLTACTNKDQNYRTKNEVKTDFVIVGRTIYNSSNMLETVKQLLQN